jgi:putative hemolysin
MSSSLFLEILLILILIFANGVFAMTEIAVLAARKSRLQHAAERGSRRAAFALDLANNPDRFLSTVQIGITLIGILAGAFGGATVAKQIDSRLEAIPALARYSEVIGVGVVVLGITYLSLVFGELVPKRVALTGPEKIALRMAPLMQQLSRLAAPAVALLSASTRFILALLRVKPSGEPAVTQEDLRALVRQGARVGTIARFEQEVVERVFRLGDRSVQAVMIPRTEIEWLDLSRPLEELRAQVLRSARGRFPAAEGGLDHIRGIVMAKELFSPGAAAGVRAVLSEPLFVPEKMQAFALLELFRSTGNHVAIVIDEYGAVEGMVTPQDILEALVGALPAPGEVDEAIVSRPDGSWLIEASVDLKDVKAAVGADSLRGEKQAFQTLGGWFTGRVGRIAKAGDSLESDGYRFEVVDTDGRRIDRILVRKVDSAPPGR